MQFFSTHGTAHISLTSALPSVCTCFLGCFCVSTLILTLLLCGSLLVHDPVWTSWFTLSAVVRGPSLYAGGWKLFQELRQQTREGHDVSQVAKVSSDGEECKGEQQEGGQQIWTWALASHFGIIEVSMIFFSDTVFVAIDTNGKIASIVNGAKQWKKTVRLVLQKSMEKKGLEACLNLALLVNLIHQRNWRNIELYCLNTNLFFINFTVWETGPVFFTRVECWWYSSIFLSSYLRVIILLQC